MSKGKFESQKRPGEICLVETKKTLEIWNELRKAISNMREKSKEISNNYGMTIEEFGLYIDNPSNFSHKDWEKIYEHRKIVFDCFKKNSMIRESMASSSHSCLKKRSNKIRRLFGPREGWIQG
ncbi:hypothetical protein [Candidatus Similichlamydia epinepheli]|uniref:hypothetical protein n=1 Tax=Candidatus Similichlamydia epinepheli TaxID=1903953 RepID=UPI000D35BD9A|nr:hypothetical protein [Candidatus Similichlamydia epinepheli]